MVGDPRWSHCVLMQNFQTRSTQPASQDEVPSAPRRRARGASPIQAVLDVGRSRPERSTRRPYVGPAKKKNVFDNGLAVVLLMTIGLAIAIPVVAVQLLLISAGAFVS